MTGHEKEVITISKHLDTMVNKALTDCKLPDDASIEILAFSLFKALFRARKNRTLSKKQLETYTRGVLNQHFLAVGLDLYVDEIDWSAKNSSIH